MLEVSGVAKGHWGDGQNSPARAGPWARAWQTWPGSGLAQALAQARAWARPGPGPGLGQAWPLGLAGPGLAGPGLAALAWPGPGPGCLAEVCQINGNLTWGLANKCQININLTCFFETFQNV